MLFLLDVILHQDLGIGVKISCVICFKLSSDIPIQIMPLLDHLSHALLLGLPLLPGEGAWKKLLLLFFLSLDGHFMSKMIEFHDNLVVFEGFEVFLAQACTLAVAESFAQIRSRLRTIDAEFIRILG